MLRQKAVISYVGIEQREAVVIRSMFRLVTWLQNEFEIPRFDEKRSPDVLLVNADDPKALKFWKSKFGDDTHRIAVMVSTRGVRFENTIPLKRPLTLHKLVDVFKHISALASQSAESGNGHRHQLSPASAAPTQSSAGEVMRILIVDDSLPVRRYMGHKIPQLASCPVKLDFAPNGTEAMEKIADSFYHVIFLDVVMPGVDGYKVCKWIKTNFISRVVLLTSRSSPFDKVRGAMSGCDNYIVKPPRDRQVEKVLNAQLKKMAKEPVFD